MRITQRAITTTSLQGLNSNLAALNKLQQQLTSGKTISAPSDSPTGTNAAMMTRQDQAGVAQQARNISDGKTVVDTTDSALRSMIAQTQRVRNLTVQALNGGAMSGTSEDAVRIEVTGIRESLLGQANQVVQGRPLFGGATSGAQAYDGTGAYVGIGGTGGVDVPVTRRVSDVEVIRVDITGPEAFGDPAEGDDLFALVGNIAAHIGDTDALTQDLADLDVALSRMATAAADVGTRSARLDTAEELNLDRSLTLKTQLSGLEDIDLARTIMEVQMQRTTYEAALSATAQVIQPTLLDFLR